MRRRLALAALLSALPLGARAQPPSAQAFLDGIYQPYRQKDFKGQPYQEADRFFAADLARAMKRNGEAAKRRGELPTLDGDPFVDAQEWQITDLAIRVSTSGEATTGVVSFANFGKPGRLAISLIQTPAGWRIADIAGANGSLRALYKLR